MNSLNPSASERLQLLTEASDLVNTVLNEAAMTGSGHRWMAGDTAAELTMQERKLNADLVRKLDFLIEDAGAGQLKTVMMTLKEAFLHSANDQAPGFMAYIPSGGTFIAAVADFISSACNRYVTIYDCCPSLASIEEECIQWMCREIVGYDFSHTGCGGVLTSGGTFSATLALHAARDANRSDYDSLRLKTLYVSEETHYCITKGAAFVGYNPANVRLIPVDDNSCIDITILKQSIVDDLEKGLIPTVVVAVAGTTNTGAVDNISGLAAVCREHGMWLHVDGAYGGAFALTERGKVLLAGLNEADSVTIDPHKGLFMPYGIGALLVKRKGALSGTNTSTGAYMQPHVGDGIDHLEDVMNMGLELTRSFRGLKMWLPLKLLGACVFTRTLDNMLDFTTWVATNIRTKAVALGLPLFISSARLSVVCFRLEPVGIAGEELDRMNVSLLDGIHERGRSLLSPIKSDSPGKFLLRIALLSCQTNWAAVENAVEDIIDVSLRLCPSSTAPSTVLTAIPSPNSSPTASDNNTNRRYLNMVSSGSDTVEDYRELAEVLLTADWYNRMFSAYGDSDEIVAVSMLDVCCGTGRWVQSYHDITLYGGLQKATVTYDGVDLCKESLGVLDLRLAHLHDNGIQRGLLAHSAAQTMFTYGREKKTTAALDDGDRNFTTSSLTVGGYDLVTNMHGFYGIPVDDVPEVLTSMVKAINSANTNARLIIALGNETGFYYKVSKTLVDAKLMQGPYTSGKDIDNALLALHLPFSYEKTILTHTVMVSESDTVALNQFLLQECTSNTYVAGQECTTDSKAVLTALAPLLDEYKHITEHGCVYKFIQHTDVFVVKQQCSGP